MNCLPSNKITINSKSRLKPIISAAQKYEQRIKSVSKNQQGVNSNVHDKYNGPVFNYDNAIFNQHVENWIKKRKEIDEWRRDVIEATKNQQPNAEESPTNTIDSRNRDSSTLTGTSTLCSAGETKPFQNMAYKTAPIPKETRQFRITKSPSIPIFNSGHCPETPDNQSYKLHNSASRRVDIYNSHTVLQQEKMIERLYQDYDDDEVFEPQYNGGARYQQQLSYNPSSQEMDHGNQTYWRRGSGYHCDAIDIHRKLTPQPTRKTMMFLPIQPNNGYSHSQPKKNLPAEGAPKLESSRWNNKQRMINSYYEQSTPSKENTEFQSSKRNLHKNESHVKLVLKTNSRPVPSRPHPSVDSPQAYYPHSPAQYQHQPHVPHGAWREPYSSDQVQCQQPLPVSASSSRRLPPPPLPPPLYRGIIKNNSYQNLRTNPDMFIPPIIPINKQLNLKLSFGSEPVLYPQLQMT